jgi:uncharacterized RDD family membrane protein YckC
METEIGKYSIDTPEQVALDFDLAGIGSRFMAVLIDHLIQVLVIVGGALLFALLGVALNPLWTVALIFLFVFVVQWGYFTIFETLRNGQTPGKKLIKIRVIKSNGRAITVFEAMTRNFLRMIDMLPTAYLVGMVTIFIDSKNRRLGDMAAGTLVVHERAEADAMALAPWKQTVASQTSGGIYDVRKLGVSDLEVIETFLARRYDIETYARNVTGEQLATMMRAKVDIQKSEAPNDETFLEELAKALRDTASFHLR